MQMSNCYLAITAFVAITKKSLIFLKPYTTWYIYERGLNFVFSVLDAIQ